MLSVSSLSLRLFDATKCNALLRSVITTRVRCVNFISISHPSRGGTERSEAAAVPLCKRAHRRCNAAFSVNIIHSQYAASKCTERMCYADFFPITLGYVQFKNGRLSIWKISYGCEIYINVDVLIWQMATIPHRSFYRKTPNFFLLNFTENSACINLAELHHSSIKL